MSKVFSRVSGAQVGRSVFNLSHEKKFTADMGQLIPVMCDEVVPGDVFSIGNECVIRFQPMIAPLLHEVNVYTHYFFVPYRLLWDDWEEFITGGVDGPQIPETGPILPRYDSTIVSVGSLWDYFGFPVGVLPDSDHLPLRFPWLAYALVWNQFYRDETLQAEISPYTPLVKRRAWEKDYFTSALPWQQRGQAPALPISGSTSAVWDTDDMDTVGVGGNDIRSTSTGFQVDSLGAAVTLKTGLDLNTIDLSSASTFDVADLRLAFQIQKWMERNARAGARYTEFLKAHFAVSPRDDRLDRPEYIGGTKAPVVVSEVLQTSSTDATSPQGNLAGHGLSVGSQFVGKYRAQEFGLILGLLSVMPRSAYQQGIDRQWLRTTRYDFYFPEFANLSEQAIERAELYLTDVEAENSTIFGYQGRYDEMRVKRSMVAGEMRDTFDYWHLGRQFASPPSLNSDFIECEPSKRIFAVQDEPGMIINYANVIKAVRPLPIASNPGLIDHG